MRKQKHDSFHSQFRNYLRGQMAQEGLSKRKINAVIRNADSGKETILSGLKKRGLSERKAVTLATRADNYVKKWIRTHKFVSLD